MKFLTQTILLIGFICVHAPSGIAQSEVPPKSSDAEQNSQIKLSYNQADDLTIASLEPILLSGESVDKLELQLMSFFRGKTPAEMPVAVTLFISSKSKKEWFDKDTELLFVLDGEPMLLGTMKRGHRSCENPLPRSKGCLHWIEKMHLFIPYQSFSRIIKAKKIEGQVADRKFVLKETDLDALRNFNKQLIPQGAKEF